MLQIILPVQLVPTDTYRQVDEAQSDVVGLYSFNYITISIISMLKSSLSVRRDRL